MREDLQAVVERVRSLAAVDLAGIITPDRLLAPGPDDEAQAWAVIARRLDDVRREEVNSGNEIDDAMVDEIAQQVFDQLLRLGPLQRHLADPDVEEVMVNGFGTAFAIRSGGRKERIATGFATEAELQAFVSRTVAATGRRLDQASPAVDARLPDGSRLHAIAPPLAPFTCLTIRRHRLLAHSLADLEALGTLTPQLRQFLAAAVRAGLNILISGGTASGKTTTLNALGSAIPASERVVTIEETVELALDRHLDDCVALEARFANVEGVGQVVIRSLVRHALRMRPNRIVVGEVRGPEALDMLGAMNSGHPGSMGTIHADGPRQALAKLRTYAMAAEERLSAEVLNDMIGDTIDLVVQLRSDPDGSRVVSAVAEVAGTDSGRVLTNDLFVTPRGIPEWTGLMPRTADRLRDSGLADDTLKVS
ncbi:MAG: Flp pilus assembly complex ATPase component TadA [Actinomycetota bacterium]|nr:Flp pilus assembly complex ATPase component TadA [Actinomycetota bacterium]